MTLTRGWLINSVSSFLLLLQPSQNLSSEQDTLVVGILTIESSYRANSEGPARKVPDTIQFWLKGDRAWRVRTFAIDHDIHVHALDRATTDRRAVVEDHIRRNYNDILAKLVVLSVGQDASLDSITLKAAGLQGSFERSSDGMTFWNPDGARYRTQSTPR